MEDIERELYAGGNDRATVLMSGSALETSLARLLASVMRDDLNSQDRNQLFEYEGAAGSFSSKIILAYALKLIGPVCRRDLDIIRQLRNEFAHSRMHFSFATPEVGAVCDQLKIVDHEGSSQPARIIDQFDEETRNKGIKHPKIRFISACYALGYRLFLKTSRIGLGSVGFPGDDPLP